MTRNVLAHTRRTEGSPTSKLGSLIYCHNKWANLARTRRSSARMRTQRRPTNAGFRRGCLSAPSMFSWSSTRSARSECGRDDGNCKRVLGPSLNRFFPLVSTLFPFVYCPFLLTRLVSSVSLSTNLHRDCGIRRRAGLRSRWQVISRPSGGGKVGPGRDYSPFTDAAFLALSQAGLGVYKKCRSTSWAICSTTCRPPPCRSRMPRLTSFLRCLASRAPRCFSAYQSSWTVTWPGEGLATHGRQRRLAHHCRPPTGSRQTSRRCRSSSRIPRWLATRTCPLGRRTAEVGCRTSACQTLLP